MAEALHPDLQRDRYFALIAEGNQRVRLVGSADRDVLLHRHWDESVALQQIFPLDGQHVVDIGSGAGFPGLALALAFPNLKTTLVESNGKKATFLESCVKNLDIGHRVQIENRFLDARSADHPHSDLYTCRALEHMDRVPHWLHRIMPSGAVAAFWVTRSLAGDWCQRYPEWEWHPFYLLPGTNERGIVLSVPRGTP